MDEIRAKQLGANLSGNTIGGWTIEKYIDCGKSAAVFRAQKDGRLGAVKIFDDELIKQYGGETQFARIERELSLIGASHPHMVSILGGGVDDNTGNHYVVMDLVDGPNLADCLQEIPPENIGSLIEQLASAAEFLEGKDLCHRDIKPENIILTKNYSHLTLLDFGVLRPFGITGVTDGETLRAFVGTLQYSSPEFLLRAEEDTRMGWRALTFYQIGGVLHDLIMRKPLFSEFLTPYAALVNAVQNEPPNIQSSTTSTQLVELAARCLLKDWKVRTKLVEWSHFKAPTASEAPANSARQRVTNRAALTKAQAAQASEKKATRPYEVIAEAIEILKLSFRSIRHDNEIFPPVNVAQAPNKQPILRATFDASLALGWPKQVEFRVKIEVLEAQSKAVEVKSNIYVGKSEKGDPPEESDFVFAGVLNVTGVREALENYIYSAVELIQLKGADVEDGWLTDIRGHGA